MNEYKCVCVHSDRRVPERRENLQKFKDGEARFLICTDVAARGIDIRGGTGWKRWPLDKGKRTR